jgi:NAD dependent epimerase/dehydratase family enzyme
VALLVVILREVCKTEVTRFVSRDLPITPPLFLTPLHRIVTVTIISRQLGPNRITWSEIEQKGLPQCDVCIQMSGAGIVDKSWTEHRKSELINSRVHLTALLVKAIQRMPKPPAVFISGSAIGYYPTHAFETFDEDYRGPPAANFAGELCYKWEEASAVLVTQTPAVRRCVLRLGLVLGRDGGVCVDASRSLAQIETSFRVGLCWTFW